MHRWPMPPVHPDSSRREFLGQALAVGAGALLAGAAQPGPAAAAVPPARPTSKSSLTAWPDLPVRILVDHDGSARLVAADRQGSRFTSAGAEVSLNPSTAGMEVRVTCPRGPLARVVLRWEATFPGDTLFLGDHWERGYGDLQWWHLQPERILPWYFAGHHEPSGRTFMAGVKTQPATLCFWTVDSAGVSLWLDFRNGGSPALPGHREIAAATVITMKAEEEESPLAALTRFCRALCPSPRLPAAPVCGNNNWYYAYGRNFNADAMRRDAVFLAEISAGHANRPFCVIDAGWTPGSVCPGGPWTAGDPGRFPDMPGLAADMKKLGVRPGIWMRPTALMRPGAEDRRRLRAGPVTAQEKPLALTLPDNLVLIHDDVARIRSWGYELIKHDFSTYDALGRWGFEMGAEVTNSGWHFNDQTLTNAEILLRHYQTLRAGAGDAMLIGCNTIGHLGAGLFEVQRTGDDTSGKVWERTRRMGVNTLAYRLPQNGTFFVCDADCAAHTDQTPWELDRQYLDLVARSRTALFVSVDPRTVQPEQKAIYKTAMMVALSGGASACEPLDWLHNTSPREWRIDGFTTTCHWEESGGAWPMKV